MAHRTIYIILCLNLLAIARHGIAQADSTIKFKNKLGILPAFFFTPETNFAFGGILFGNFKLSQDSITRNSNSQLFLNYTLNSQYLISSEYSIFFNENKYYLKGGWDYLKYPSYFFGIGNQTEICNKKDIEYKLLKSRNQFYIKAKKDLYCGIITHFENLFNLDQEVKNNSPERMVHGSTGYNLLGIGLGILKDKRDNQLNPSRGHFIECNFEVYPNQYYSYMVDFRTYHLHKSKIVLNTNLFLGFKNGKVPFAMMHTLGGPRFLRGYYFGRFRDNNMFVYQAETRIPMYKGIGLALFTGVGQVFQRVQDFELTQLHKNIGFGLRLTIDKAQNTNLRIDYGITNDSRGLYVVYAEAF